MPERMQIRDDDGTSLDGLRDEKVVTKAPTKS